MKDKLINYIENEIYFRVAQSPVHGVGLFAIKDIPKGTDIFVEFDDITDGETPHEFKVALNKMESIPSSVKILLRDYQTTDENFQFIYLPPNYKYIHSFWINHSDNPNGYFFTRENESRGFITIKFIKEGEEIFEDYNLLEDIGPLE